MTMPAKTHGLTGTPTYHTWQAMRRRCEDPNFIEYPSYGAKGVRVYPEWSLSFAAFLRDMGAKPRGTSIDRIDPAGDYVPANCRWATRKEQNSNRRNVRNLTHDGRTMHMADWAKELGFDHSWFRKLVVLRGLSVEQILAGVR